MQWRAAEFGASEALRLQSAALSACKRLQAPALVV